ncbi:MAG: type II toxin-antitoxin system VapC family toxin [Planctomycetota bacterium]|nr:MAG: type II toxin-antitoxin system VapC family toxin [Planctomycetota bacterium]
MILDTCGLLAWLYQPDALSPATRSAVDQARTNGHLGLAAVSIWEVVWKHRLGKLPLPGSPALFYEQVQQLRLRIHAADHALWWQVATLDWEHRDPADRLIVATAASKDLPLVTNDRRMQAFYHNCLW